MEDLFDNPLIVLGIFVAACYALTFITRHIVEAWLPGLKKKADENAPSPSYLSTASRWWNQVILYALAPGWGVLFAIKLRDNEGWPSSFKELDAAIMFGIAFGFICGFVFKIFKRVLAMRAGVDTKDVSVDSDPPPGE